MSEYDQLTDPSYRIFLQAWHGWSNETTDYVLASLRRWREQERRIWARYRATADPPDPSDIR